jgi:hypothetical protein
MAELADRRFHTSDLLATAYALRGSADPWHANIRSQADHRVLGISAALLTPHRLGPRTWSGICLSLIAAITLGLLSATMPADRAQAVAAPTILDSPAEWKQPREAPVPSIAQSTEAREAKAQANPDSLSTNKWDDAPNGSRTWRRDGSNREGQAVTGAGGGSARSDSPEVAMPADRAALAGRDSIESGTIALGGEGGEVRSQPGGGATGGQVTASQGADPASWSAPDWPVAQTAASQAIRAGQIPDAYRNLVRDYFDRSDASAHQ